LEKLDYEVDTLVIKNIYNEKNKVCNKLKKVLKMKPQIIFKKAFLRIKKKLSSFVTKTYIDERTNIFKNFSQKYLSEKNYVNSDKDLSYISNFYDFFICGSDQIWNPYFFDDNYKKLNINFLTPFPKNKRIAYAPSFGVSMIPEEDRDNYKKRISEIPHLSVREKSGAEIIKRLSSREAPVLVDPTLLLTKNEWLAISIPAENKPKSKYLLTYFLGEVSKQREKLINDIVKKYGLEIVKLADLKDKKAYTTGPCEFIDYINSAFLVLTDSFHGVIFSILLYTPFIVFERIGGKSMYSRMYSRVETLLEMANLKSREEKNIDFSKDLLDMDFSHVEKILYIERKRSFDFLKNALAENVSTSQKKAINHKIAFEEIGKTKCTGCSLCANVCPSKAIKMKLDENGFYFPEIDFDKCTRCGICYAKCPVINYENNNRKTPKSYAAYTKDEEILRKSSSGGMFSELAKNILRQNGVVYGVAWNYENISVDHIRIDNLKDIEKLRGSKYLQSHVGNTYNRVKKDIHENKKVLFVGIPCQVAAINNLICSENLFTVDLICHGVPSLMVFRQYLKENFDTIIDNVDFRNKKKGWKNYFVKIQNNYYPHPRNPFFKGFLDNLYLNDICYYCPFSKIPRVGDITLGDYWGVPKEVDNDNKGVSAVLVNNEKGEKLFNILDNIVFFEQDLEVIKKGNPRLYLGHNNNFELKESVMSDFKSHGFNYMRKKYIKIQPQIIVISRKALSKIKRTAIKILNKGKS